MSENINIKDEQTKEILSGVLIYINDLKTGATTDKEGNFKLENIKTGTYLFEISLIGYKKSVKRWEATCRKAKIPFHAIAERGFYRLK